MKSKSPLPAFFTLLCGILFLFSLGGLLASHLRPADLGSQWALRSALSAYFLWPVFFFSLAFLLGRLCRVRLGLRRLPLLLGLAALAPFLAYLILAALVFAGAASFPRWSRFFYENPWIYLFSGFLFSAGLRGNTGSPADLPG